MRRRPLLLIFPILLLVAVWCGAWFWAEANLRQGLERWQMEQAALGRRVEFETLEIGGFPFRLKLAVTGPSVADESGWHWRGPPLHGTAVLWAPRRLILSFPGQHELAWAENRARLVVTEAEGIAELDRRGRLLSGRLRLMDLLLEEERGMEARAESLELDLGATAGERGEAAGYPFRLSLLALVLPAELDSPLGGEVARLVLAGHVTGPLPRTAEAAALEAWRAAGGSLELSTLELEHGPLALTGEGTARLDEELRPHGSLTARIAGLPATIDRLAEAGLLTPAGALTLKFGAAVAANERDDAGRALVVLPITAEDGLLFLGPIAFLRLRPLA